MRLVHLLVPPEVMKAVKGARHVDGFQGYFADFFELEFFSFLGSLILSGYRVDVSPPFENQPTKLVAKKIA